MVIKEFDFFDPIRNRRVPVLVYLPKSEGQRVNVVIYNPGYGGGKESFADYEKGVCKMPYKNNSYLAAFFTNKGYAFVSIQHDLLGDEDGLETLDPKAVQAVLRKPLWERGVKNMIFVINELKKKNDLELNLKSFIVGGHSNGGDISKYFANLYPEVVSHVIVCDGRRCPLSPTAKLKVLMFEANDTTTDPGVIPGIGDCTEHERDNIEYVVVKPRNATHSSYSDDGSNEIKHQVCHTISWFLDTHGVALGLKTNWRLGV